MAAVVQHGTSLGALLVGFTALVAGLVAGGGLGIVIAIVGIGLLGYSLIGFRKVRAM